MNKQEPVGEVNDKGKGNVRKVSIAGMSWVDFARPYMQGKKKGGMKKAGEDWRKLKAKKAKKTTKKQDKSKIMKNGKLQVKIKKRGKKTEEMGGY